MLDPQQMPRNFGPYPGHGGDRMTTEDAYKLAQIEVKVEALEKGQSAILEKLDEIKSSMDNRDRDLEEKVSKQDSRIAVLESVNARLEKFAWGTGGTAAIAMLGHAPAVISGFNGAV